MASTYEDLMAKARELDANGDTEGAKRLAKIALSRQQPPGNGREMTMRERIDAAKNGTLTMDPASLAGHENADETSLRGLEPPEPSTAYGIYEQGASGLNEGLASLMGAPVDIVNAGVNLGIAGVNNLAGTDLAPIENPVGGSGTFKNLMDPFIVDRAPDGAAERYARRIGSEVGFGAPIAMATGGGGALAKLMAMNATADTAAGVAGQTAREIAPDSDTADLIASLLGGMGTAGGFAAASRGKPPAPYATTEEMFDASEGLYERAYASGAELTPSARDEFNAMLDRALEGASASPVRHPRAFDAVEAAKARPGNDLKSLEDARYVMGRDVASNPVEAGVGSSLKNEITDFLNGLDASKVTGGSPEQAVHDLTRARSLHHQGSKAKTVEGEAYRASRRAATSGRGGNEVNAMRQNVGRILDNEVAPRRRGKGSGYTPDEIEQMEKISFGTPGQNRMRHVAGLSPTTGSLQASAGLLGAGGGAGMALTTGNPAFLLGALPAIGGKIAKGLAERGTGKQIEELLDIIRRGGTSADKTAGPNALRALFSQALSQSDAFAPQ